VTPERTTDGRWIVVDGRRWRATDPAVPDDVRARLQGTSAAPGPAWWDQDEPTRRARWEQALRDLDR
jgi:hypothetical protein